MTADPWARLTDEQRRLVAAQVDEARSGQPGKNEGEGTGLVGCHIPSSPSSPIEPEYADDAVTLYAGDCLDVLRTLPDHCVDAVVTDPPYGLGFMGKEWDSPGGTGDFPMRRFDAINTVNTGASRQGGRQRSCDDFTRRQARDARTYQEWCEQWARECLRVLKPGGHLLAFGGTRTAHRLACAIEDAGFELRDTIAWLYGSGFPKSLDVSKAIDKAQGVMGSLGGPKSAAHAGWIERGAMRGQAGSEGHEGWQSPWMDDPQAVDRNAREYLPASERAQSYKGWGTALKPANEPILVARKSPVGTVAANVLAYGTGGLNVDGCRTESGADYFAHSGDRQGGNHRHDVGLSGQTRETSFSPGVGRWPTNVVLDPAAAAVLDVQTGTLTSGANPTRRGSDGLRDAYGDFKGQESCDPARGADSGGASRFFPVFRYEAKAPADERPRVGDVAHPTVKPLDLMRWLVRLVTPPGGLVLEPFAGSGTTAEACIVEGFRCIAIEREVDYIPLILARITKPIEPVLFGGAE